ncbi:MAG TPA: SGNH/GDSL hydrolase family protein [Chitinophagaceae bacterium]|nr:SGNH/GDSL hydrolase family protein [Chitinophagaceae bacterium]
MRELLMKKASSSLVAAMGLILLLIFIAAMKQRPLQNKTYSYLALGDSYTIGEGIAIKESFPHQVVDMLRAKGMEFKAPKVIAKTGWTTDELQTAIQNSNLEGRYDFVSLLIGVNNQYRKRKVDEYLLEFESLVKQAILFAGNDPKKVIVLSIPDWSVTPFGAGATQARIASEIDQFNEANTQVAEKYHVHYINITPGTRQAARDAGLVAEDGLHPSAKEYRKWAKKVAAVISSGL